MPGAIYGSDQWPLCFINSVQRRHPDAAGVFALCAQYSLSTAAANGDIYSSVDTGNFICMAVAYFAVGFGGKLYTNLRCISAPAIDDAFTDALG
ncbi:hypothetical protein W04_3595 [Pseudoalteromonas sp. SW0106-04]|nr:hypothetical protein W04_3595 [Pseudoalteromonas sp. SW0106-04]